VSQRNEIREDLVIHDTAAVQALTRVNSAVGRVVGGLGGMLNTLKSVAGLGALFSIGEGLRSTDQLYQRIGRIKTVTGESAADIHAMHDALEITGFAGERVEGVIVRMAKQLTRTGKAGQEMRRDWARMGVDVHDNMTSQLLQLSKAAQEGKVGVGGLMKSFGIGRNDAAALLKSLQQGPEEFRKIMRDTKNGADLVDDAALASYEKMRRARAELSDAWDEVVGKIYKNLIPAMTSFFQFVTKHMDAIISAAKVFAATMAGNKVLNLLTGKGIGGNVAGALTSAITKATKISAVTKETVAVAELAKTMKTGSWAQNLGKALASAGKAAGAGPVSMAGAGGMNFGRAIADAARIKQGMAGMSATGAGITGMVGKISPQLGKLMASGNAMSTLVSSAAKFGPYGIAIAVALFMLYKAFRYIQTSGSDLAKSVRATFSEIWAKIQAIIQSLQPLWDALHKIFTVLLNQSIKMVVMEIAVMAESLNLALRLIITIGNVMSELINSPWWFVNHPMRAFQKAWEESDITTDLIKKKAAGKGDGKPPPTYNDFRGSHFDVTQNFAEGFDPGRIAATFGDELIKLSDRKLQSGFAPLYAMRGRL
jgi:hypothetical protein